MNHVKRVDFMCSALSAAVLFIHSPTEFSGGSFGEMAKLSETYDFDMQVWIRAARYVENME